MESKARRVRAFRGFIAHAREKLGLTLGFRLWDGSTVPEDLGPNSLAVVIADENAVAALEKPSGGFGDAIRCVHVGPRECRLA